MRSNDTSLESAKLTESEKKFQTRRVNFEKLVKCQIWTRLQKSTRLVWISFQTLVNFALFKLVLLLFLHWFIVKRNSNKASSFWQTCPNLTFYTFVKIDSPCLNFFLDSLSTLHSLNLCRCSPFSDLLSKEIQTKQVVFEKLVQI